MIYELLKITVYKRLNITLKIANTGKAAKYYLLKYLNTLDLSNVCSHVSGINDDRPMQICFEHLYSVIFFTYLTGLLGCSQEYYLCNDGDWRKLCKDCGKTQPYASLLESYENVVSPNMEV